jgi:hypothetical protein
LPESGTYEIDKTVLGEAEFDSEHLEAILAGKHFQEIDRRLRKHPVNVCLLLVEDLAYVHVGSSRAEVGNERCLERCGIVGQTHRIHDAIQATVDVRFDAFHQVLVQAAANESGADLAFERGVDAREICVAFALMPGDGSGNFAPAEQPFNLLRREDSEPSGRAAAVGRAQLRTS